MRILFDRRRVERWVKSEALRLEPKRSLEMTPVPLGCSKATWAVVELLPLQKTMA
jgi:hypothetical protein